MKGLLHDIKQRPVFLHNKVEHNLQPDQGNHKFYDYLGVITRTKAINTNHILRVLCKRIKSFPIAI